MQKHILTILLSCTVFIAQCQIIPESQVPFPVLTSFQSGFPTITNVQWSVNNNFYNCNFEVDQLKKIVTYNEKGEYIESRAGILLTELPPSIQEYVKLHGEGDFEKEYYKVLKADGVESYEVMIKKIITSFDATGLLIKTSAAD